MDDVARPLLPYVPRLVVEWLETDPALTARTLDATVVFADISGFTALTERLARRGKVGAEEMGDILNRVFGSLLAAAYEYGAELVKWGGDAVLLLFRGDVHPHRAATAARRMQQVIDRVGRVRTSSGSVRLGMSVGVHTGTPDCLLVGEVFRELVLTGPDVTEVALLEAAASAGEVVVSDRTAALLEDAGGVVGAAVGPGRLLLEPPRLVWDGGAGPAPRATEVELRSALPPPLARHLTAGTVAYEHRVVAICFIEFSEVDRLRATTSAEDVADAVELVVSAAQRAAAAHGVTFLASDVCPDGGKVILAAGVPSSRGDDTTRVLAAAREVLDSEQRLVLRAGVNVGRVFAGDYGSDLRRVYSITGDCVNLAARLMAKAEPGELVVSTAALERSRTGWTVRELEPFPVKGKSEPVRAAVVTGPVERGRRADAALPLQAAATPFVGREKELDLLLDAWSEAVSGRGRLVDLRGETGIGKSRLVHELLARTGARAQWLRGDIFASGTPYAPFHRIVDAAGLARLVDEVAPDLRPMLPLIEVVAGVGVADKAALDEHFGDARKELMEAAASQLLGRMFGDPTVWVFDDVQFTDAASADLLTRLARDAVDRPWLIVTTSRPDCHWLPPEDAPATTLEIAPLTVDAVADLAAAHETGSSAPAHRLASIFARADGNPLFLTELLEATRSGAADLADLPETVEAAVSARIDQLSPGHRRLLRAASVLGSTVDVPLLEELSSRVPEVAADAADVAELAEFLAPVEQGRLRFRHGLVQETAYAGLPFRRRTQLHAAAADAIAAHEPDDAARTGLLSLHCLRGERFAEAFRHSVAGAQHAAAHHAHAEAVGLYLRALEASRHLRLPARQLVPVREGLAEAYHYVGDVAGMESVLRRARRAVGEDPLAYARLAMLWTYQRRQTGRHVSALQWAARGRRALEGRTDRAALRVLAELADSAAQSMLQRGRFAEAEAWAERCATEAAAGRDRRRQVWARQLGAIARYYAGGTVELAELVANAEEQERLGDLKRAARTHNVIGVLAFDERSWPTALEHYERSTDLYRTIGRPLDIALQLANSAEVLIFQRRLDEAEERLVEAFRLWRGAPMNGEQAFGLTQRARCAMARGDHDEARELYDQARAVHIANDELPQLVIVDGMLAECHLLAGDARAALDLIVDLQCRNERIGADLDYLSRIHGLAEVGAGLREQGLARLRGALDTARRTGQLYDEWRCLDELVGLGEATPEDVAVLPDLQRSVDERLGVRVLSASTGTRHSGG